MRVKTQHQQLRRHHWHACVARVRSVRVGEACVRAKLRERVRQQQQQQLQQQRLSIRSLWVRVSRPKWLQTVVLGAHHGTCALEQS